MISFELEHNARLALLMVAGELAYAALLVGLLAGTGASGTIVTAFMVAMPVMMSVWSAMALLIASGDWDTPAALRPAILSAVLGLEALFLPLAILGPPVETTADLFSAPQGQIAVVVLGTAWGVAVAAALPFTTGDRIRLEHIVVTALAGIAGVLVVPVAWVALLALRLREALAFGGGYLVEAAFTAALALPAAYLCGRVFGLAAYRLLERERPLASRISDAR